MSYYLGVDVGTTYTAAAVWRDGRVEVANLGNRASVVPSVVCVRDGGEVLVGEAAERRATTDPQGVAREFKRRLGDPTPIIIGGTSYTAEELTASLLRWVVAKVGEAEGGLPIGIAVSHPANWGDYKKDLLGQAVTRAELVNVSTVTEPEAAAIHYATQERVEPGAVIAVYDLGGGTFDVALLRKTATGWDILGEPQGIERLGGIDFDEAGFRHVVASAGNPLDDLDPDDPTALAAVARLRQECIEAKEALSADTDVVIPVLLPGHQAEVRLTRSEFEQMVRPPLADSIAAMDRALRAAGVEPADVTTVLLVGGSSRVPLVAQLVGSGLGRPVAVDAHPKYAVSLGAAIVAAERDIRDAALTSRIAVVPELVAPAVAVAAALGAEALAGTGGETADEPVLPSPQPAAADAAAAGLAAGLAADTTQPPPTEPVVAEPMVAEPVAEAGAESPTEPITADLAPTQPGDALGGEPPVTPAAGAFADTQGGYSPDAPTEIVGASEPPTQIQTRPSRPPPPGAPGGGRGAGRDAARGGKRRRPMWALVAAAVAVLFVGGIALASLAGDGDDGGETLETTTTTRPVTTTTPTTLPPTTQDTTPITTTTTQQETTTTTEATTTTTEATTTTTEPTTTTSSTTTTTEP